MAIPFETRPSGRLIAKKAWASTVQIGYILVWSFVAAPVAVAMHRFILLGRTTKGVLSFGPQYVRAFLFWAVGLKLATSMLGVLTDLFSRFSLATGALVGLAFGVLQLVAFVYFAMVFPAVATEVPAENWRVRITRSAQQIRGNFWLFVGSAILAFLPLVAIHLVFWILFGGLHASLLKGDLRESFRLGLAVLTGMFSVFGIMLGAAVASWLYAWTSHEPAGEPIS
jgi:hypothetical protein